MRLVCLMSVYNEQPGIARAILSVGPWVDEVVVLDGAYRVFPGGQARSTDGTVETAESLGARVIVPDSIWEDQIEKRTALLGLVEPGDAFLILDGDEWVANGWELDGCRAALEADLWDVGWLETYSSLYDRIYRSPRVFRAVPGMHYRGRHHWIYDGEGLVIASHQVGGTAYRHTDVALKLWNFRRGGARDRLKEVVRQRRRELGVQEAIRDDDETFSHPQAAGDLAPQWQVLHQRKPDDLEPPLHALVCPFSRPWALRRWVEHFRTVEIPPETELLAIVDHHDAGFFAQAEALLGRLDRFTSVKVLWTRQTALPQTSAVSARRDRICRNWLRFLTEIRAPFLLGAEDDTLPDPDAYRRLMDIVRNGEAQFAQGTELGRWGPNLVPHWSILEGPEGIHTIETAAPIEGLDRVEIEGGGWYLFATVTDLLRAITLRWSTDPPMGPDLCCVWDLRQMGARAVGCWDICALHFDPYRTLDPRKDRIDQLTWQRQEDGRWVMRERIARAPLHTTERTFKTMKKDAGTYRRVTAIRTGHCSEISAITGRPEDGMLFAGAVLELPWDVATVLEQRGMVRASTPEEVRAATMTTQTVQPETKETKPSVRVKDEAKEKAAAKPKAKSSSRKKAKAD